MLILKQIHLCGPAVYVGLSILKVRLVLKYANVIVLQKHVNQNIKSAKNMIRFIRFFFLFHDKKKRKCFHFKALEVKC